MDNLIKNIHLLTGIVKPDGLDKMEYAALEHKRHSNVTFKILKIDNNSVVMQAEQGKSSNNNYQSGKQLSDNVHETFDRFFPGRKIKVHPVTYKDPACNKVTPAWLQNKMKNTGIKLKQIANDTGLDYPNLSTILNSDEPISQPMKVALYYYFLAKQ